MHEGIKVLKQTGFIGGRVHKSPNARPRPKYYEMADGSSLPANIGPDQLKKAILAGAIREVPAPPVVAESVETKTVIQPTAPVVDDINVRRKLAQEEYEAKLEELSKARNEALAQIEADEKALEKAPEETTHLTPLQALEDLEWALQEYNCYLIDHEGNPLQKVRIAGGL